MEGGDSTGPEGLGGVGGDGAECWGDGGDDGCCEQGGKWGGEDRWVGRLGLVEESGGVVGGDDAERQADGRAERDGDEDIGENDAGDCGGLGSDGDADGKFALALNDRVVKDAIEADTREDQCDGGEK